MSELEIGQTVQLRTGGCLMTVEAWNQEARKQVDCVWFDDAGELKHGSFARKSLRCVTVEGD